MLLQWTFAQLHTYVHLKKHKCYIHIIDQKLTFLQFNLSFTLKCSSWLHSFPCQQTNYCQKHFTYYYVRHSHTDSAILECCAICEFHTGVCQFCFGLEKLGLIPSRGGDFSWSQCPTCFGVTLYPIQHTMGVNSSHLKQHGMELSSTSLIIPLQWGDSAEELGQNLSSIYMQSLPLTMEKKVQSQNRCGICEQSGTGSSSSPLSLPYHKCSILIHSSVTDTA